MSDQPTLLLFNTITREKEPLKPLEEGHVRMYTCGPTVYHFAHIGNFRTYVFEDLLRRTIKFLGMKITHVMNLTDVDDKTLKGAISRDITLNEFTQPYKDAFFEDLQTLNIEKAEHYPAATDYIPEMIKVIQGLLDKGVAYQGGDGSIYYAIGKFPRYGCLSHLHLDELKAGASERVAADEYDKDHVADFVLWKKYDPSRDGKIYWDSPFGKGRPGWHIECSAMAMSLLGSTLDIHVGGVDNMFPHHENEIAQSEAYSGQNFANMWLHSEHLVVDNKKMSKSLGNFYTLRDLLNKGFTGIQVRYMLLQTHYKTQLNFTFTGLEAVKHTLQRLQDFLQRMVEIRIPGKTGSVDQILIQTLESFTNSLADDLNISAGLAAIFEGVREINALADKNQVYREDADQVIHLLKKVNTVLGVLSFENPLDGIPQDLEEALNNRNLARKNKNWAEADALRDIILSRGYIIEDTPAGARLKKQS
jgi:cysteinyl-tRNA synthetase